MQFIKNGPNIPDSILKAQDAGKLIFFCGAGISYNLGLPDFNGLVDMVRSELGLDQNESLPDGISKEEYKNANYLNRNYYLHPEQFLNYLAKHLDSDNNTSEQGFKSVKKAIIKSLEITKEITKKNYKTHKAILNLSNHHGCFRIITTNADHGFIRAAKNMKLKNFSVDSYPYLPPVNQENLKHPVHLHGIINKNDPDGNNLIFTSADFGKAYLTDARAAKFIADLFSGEFTVLFVGYSLNDPVIRYVTDALARDGCMKDKVYALAPYDPTKTDDEKYVKEQWRFKGIKPLLYSDEKNHTALHETLKVWDILFNVLGRKGTINKYASINPNILSDTPDRKHQIDWVVWAIDDQSGDAPQFFTRLDPTPPIEWLRIFRDKGLLYTKHEQLYPCVYIPQQQKTIPDLNSIQSHLLNWIKEHLDNSTLFTILIETGNTLHPKLREIIKSYLNDKNDLSSPLDRSWKLLLQVKEPEKVSFPLKDNKDTNVLLDCIRPYIKISPFQNDREKEWSSDCNDPRKFANITVVTQKFAFDLAYIQFINDPKKLINNAFVFTKMLEELCDIRSLYITEEFNSGYRPSIKDHKKNKHMEDWTKLIDLVRDSWKALLDSDKKLAHQLSDSWQDIQYGIFRRLVLYVMTESDLYSLNEILGYLLADKGKWLWELETKCENYELIKAKGGLFSQKQINLLIKTAFESYKSSDQKTNRELYWKLKDIKQYMQKKISLPKMAKGLLVKHNNSFERYEWQKRFHIGPVTGGWVGENSDYSFEELSRLSPPELYAKLTTCDRSNELEERKSAWLSGLKKHPQSAINLANHMLDGKKWKNEKDLAIWKLIFSGLENHIISWQILSNALLHKLPKSFYNNNNFRCITFWFHSMVSKISLDQEETFLNIIKDIFLKLPSNILSPTNVIDHSKEDVLLMAINTPIGKIMQSLITFMGQKQMKVKALMPIKFKEIFNDLLSYGPCVYAILGSSLNYLFAIDPEWIKLNVINKLNSFSENSTNNEVPMSIWVGYLYNQSISLELAQELNSSLQTLVQSTQGASVFTEKIQNELIRFFILSCLYFPTVFEFKNIQPILAKMKNENLTIASQALLQYIASSKKPDLCWSKQLSNFIEKCWPQKIELNKGMVTICFAKIILTLEDEQNNAFNKLKKYMQKINDTNAYNLYGLRLMSTNTKMLLNIYTRIVGTNNLSDIMKDHLLDNLAKIKHDDPDIQNNSTFKKLWSSCTYLGGRSE